MSKLNYKNTCIFKLKLILVTIKILREGFGRRLKRLRKVEIVLTKKRSIRYSDQTIFAKERLFAQRAIQETLTVKSLKNLHVAFLKKTSHLNKTL
jgi:hypothetical protein